MLTRLRRRPSPAMVVALLALFVALDGPATAAHLLDGRTIKSNSITAKQIRNRTIGTRDLSRSAIKSLERTPSGSITARQIAPESIDASRMAPGLLGAAGLAPGSVDASRLAPNAVGSTQLAAGAVTPSKLADSSVGAGAVANGSLQTRDLGDFAGSVKIPFDPFRANTCQVATLTPAPSVPGQNPKIADDVVAVSPQPGWPDPIVVSGYPGANNTLRIVACRIGGNPDDANDTIPTPEKIAEQGEAKLNGMFQYVGFDAP